MLKNLQREEEAVRPEGPCKERTGESDADLLRRQRRLSRDSAITLERWAEKYGHVPRSERKPIFNRVQRLVERQFLPHYFTEPPAWRMALRRFGRKRGFPDFCVVGPIKAGTTDLAVHLMLHPNVMVPLTKEFEPRNVADWQIQYPTLREKMGHASRFGLALSPYLVPALHWMEMAHSLSALNPKARIVITLRHPAKRLYSHWKWEVFLAGRRRASTLPFLATFSGYVDKALELHSVGQMFTACGSEGLVTSIYWKAVQYWIACFGRDNVLVLDVDEYFRDRESALRRIHDFVGLPRWSGPTVSRVINENPLKLAPPNEESLGKLNAFFKPHNKKLWQVIGETFEW